MCWLAPTELTEQVNSIINNAWHKPFTGSITIRDDNEGVEWLLDCQDGKLEWMELHAPVM